MIVLDANVLIGFLDADDAHHATTLALLQEHDGEGFGASVLTIAEALVHPARAQRADAAAAALDRIGVRILSLTESDTLPLARIRAEYRVRMPDAVALHAALTTRSALATFDTTLAEAAGLAGVRVVTD